MTRILVLVTSLDRGGIESMLMNYYRRLDKRRFQFDFLVNRTQKGVYEDEILALGGKIYRMVPMYPWKYLQYRRELKQFLSKHPEYKIIHSHLEERSYWPLAIARRVGVPVRIAHIHNYYPLALHPKTPFRQWFRYGLRRRDIVTKRLACSKTAGRWLFGKTAEFEVVVDAIDEQRFGFDTKKRALVRQQLGISPEATVLGQVGRLVTQKNPLFALTVFGAAGRVMEVDGGKLDSLIYVGKGNLEHKLREQVANRIGKTQEVLVVSPVDNVQDYYAAFDALLLPSLYEGLGMVAVEAGISGLPVLASDRVPAEANVAKNLTYLPLAQPWTWVMALEKLVPRNIVERVSASKRATKAVIAAGYDVESAVKKLEELYEDLAH